MYPLSRFLIGLFLLLAITGLSQTATLKGKIINENGQPIDDVEIYLLTNKQKGTTSTKEGYYELVLPAQKKLEIIFSHASYSKQTLNIELIENQTRQFDVILMSGRTTDTIDIVAERIITLDPLPKIQFNKIPNSTGIEGALKLFGLGVTSNNEMSSTYNVRGGNYDENLIYVNNIEIYRPLLVRSGQQEGLSFINPDLVDNINFSSGGFEARYGDKLSSVLDITYRKPDSAAGTVTASLLGTNLHFEGKPSNRFNYLMGFRYRTNSYLLNSLNTQGSYKPFFADGQVLMNYYIRDDWKLSFLGHFSRNKYNFVPETRTTEFGNINEALRLTVYFDGQELNEFNTSLGAVTLEHTSPNNRNKYTWISSAYRSNEDESYDIMGQYRLEELERDMGSDNFGEVAFLRGVGTYLNHARNRLDVTVYNSRFIGEHLFKNEKHKLFWGAKFQGEIIKDTMSEWQMIDSAGFSIPQTPTDIIQLNEVIKSSADLHTYRAEGYVQHNWKVSKEYNYEFHDTIVPRLKELNISSGVRANYWTLNGQTVVSPRVRATYFPGWWKFKNGIAQRRNISLRAAAGVYYQPPFYRELRNLSGEHNYDLKAQRSIHFIFGGDVFFKMWDRVFLFTTEAYYKHLSFIIPYEIDNVRIRYYAQNNAKGYAAGLDMRVNGEFIKGIQSWATLSILKTVEDIEGDHYTEYYNADGDVITPGFGETVASSQEIYPKYIPRPADQRVNFTIFFQDEMPKWPEYKVHLSFVFGSGLPFGPPSYDRYKDILRMPPYRRVDIGFSRQFLTDKSKLREGSKLRNLGDLWLSLEVFNLLGIDNTISYLWIEDSQGLQYAVPNYLTSRRINLKLMVKF